MGAAVELARAGAVAAPQRIVAALTGHATALALVAASPLAGRLAGAYLQGGVLLAATVAAGVAAAVDRRELRSMAAVDLCGASALQRRLVVVVEGTLLGVAALPVGLAGAAVACVVGDERAPRVLPAVATALVVPALVTLFAGRVRTRVTVVDASPGLQADPVAREGLDRLRCLVGAMLVVSATLLSRHLRAFSELDLALGPLLVLAAAGLVLALPPLAGWLGGHMVRSRSAAVALAGSALRERRRLLAPAASLGAVAAMVVTVQAVVGLGLAEREQARRDQLGGATRFTAGLSDRDVFVGRDNPMPLGLGMAFTSMSDALHVAVPDALAGEIGRVVPGARVAGIDVLPVDVVGDPLLPRRSSYEVAVGTPELLAALGLERYANDLAAGRAVALDPVAVVGGRVMLEGSRLVAEGWHRSLPARLVQQRVVPRYQPSVLVPAPIGESVRQAARTPGGWPNVNPAALAVGRDRPFTDAELRAIRGAVRRVPEPGAGGDDSLTVVRGDHRVPEVFERDRLDASFAIVVGSPGDVRVAMAVAVIVSLVALAVALWLAALTGRSDDELLSVLGARAATLRWAAMAQALVLGLLAVPLGAAVGVTAARVGVDGYNRHGRFSGGVELPPIPLGVPVELVVGAVAVPLAAALLAALLTHRRHPTDPRSLADRLTS